MGTCNRPQFPVVGRGGGSFLPGIVLSHGAVLVFVVFPEASTGLCRGFLSLCVCVSGGVLLFIDLLITPGRIQEGRGLQRHPLSQLAGASERVQ